MKRMHRKIVFTTLLCGVLVSGCVTTEPCRRILDNRAPVTGMRLNAVNIVDQSLHTKKVWATYCEGRRISTTSGDFTKDNPAELFERFKITVENHNSRPTPTGTMEVWTVVRNQTDFPLQMEARTWFFDRHEIPSEKPTAWQRVYLPPQSIGNYREFSTPEQDAHHYFVEIREGR